MLTITKEHRKQFVHYVKELVRKDITYLGYLQHDTDGDIYVYYTFAALQALKLPNYDFDNIEYEDGLTRLAESTITDLLNEAQQATDAEKKAMYKAIAKYIRSDIQLYGMPSEPTVYLIQICKKRLVYGDLRRDLYAYSTVEIARQYKG